MKDVAKHLLAAALLGLVTLAGWVVTLRADVRHLEAELSAQRARMDRLVERQVYFHGEAERQ